MSMRALRFLLLLLWPSLLLAQNFDEVLSPGELVMWHAKWANDCAVCHKRFDKSAQTALCVDCHKAIAADIRTKTRYHGRLKEKECRACHTEHKGPNARIIKLDQAKFDHDETDYRLKGAHREAREKCASCHRSGRKYRDTPRLCNDCHRKDDVHKGKLGLKCESCHGEVKWKEHTFDHSKTNFKLENKHGDAKCKDCHQDRGYRDTPKDCYSCHRKTDDSDGHAGQFGTKCQECHGTKTWEENSFDHGKTKFALRGKHEEAECTACHKGKLYQEKLALKCVGCHRKDDNEKGHKGSLGEKCETCHDEKSWKTSRFDHDKDTDYPLTGRHAKVKCNDCHKGGVTATAGKLPEKLGTTCIACHRKFDDEKGHKGKYGEKCESCHVTDGWKEIRFDHLRDTKYALSGKHAKTACKNCHTGTLYKDKTPKECYACHKKEDQEKGHRGTLGTRCADCHGEAAWKIERFDHNRSRFPLTGGHAAVECKKCHPDVKYRGVPMTCIGCHEKEDVHKMRLGPECKNCHNTRNWKLWDFDHGKTRFKLDGAHARIECYACHRVAVKKAPKLDTTCFSCHAQDDVHERNFGIQCEKCHGTANWHNVTHRALRPDGSVVP